MPPETRNLFLGYFMLIFNQSIGLFRFVESSPPIIVCPFVVIIISIILFWSFQSLTVRIKSLSVVMMMGKSDQHRKEKRREKELNMRKEAKLIRNHVNNNINLIQKTVNDGNKDMK